MVKPWVFLGALALVACTFPEEPLPPGDSRVVVHAILDPSRSRQVISLAVTHGAAIAPADLDSAAVVVTTPGGLELAARQDSMLPTNDYFPRSTHDYSIDLADAGVSLEPGGTYQLRITLRSGHLITGSTTIPGASPAPAPQVAQLIRERDTVHVSWEPVAGARSYELQVWITFAQFNSSNWRTHSAFVSVPQSLAGTATTWDDEEVFSRGTRAAVLLFAVDENYYEYYRMVGDPYVGAAPTRIQGALGVFGSVVPVVRREFDVK